MPVKPPGDSDYQGLALLGVAVGEIVVCVLIGMWADDRWQISPWGVMIGATLGIIGSVVQLLLRSGNRGSIRKPD